MYLRMALVKQCKIVRTKSHLQKLFLRKNVEVQYIESDMSVSEILPIENYNN